MSESFVKQLCMQLIAGGSAGCVEVSIMHPLDLVKTRFQLQSSRVDPSKAGQNYSGLGDCFRKMYRSEGITAFWKGVVPPILVETPKRAWKFCTFEQFKTVLIFHPNQPHALTFSLAGLFSGVTEAIIVNPFEVVKVKMQSDRSNRSEASLRPSTFVVAKRIVRESGLFGNQGLLTKGITATMGRNGFFNMIYFGFYHSVKGYFPAVEDHTMEFFRKLGIGLIAGTFASCINIPFDVAKSRIQGPQPVRGQIKYVGTLRTISTVYSEEGFRALYKGLLPKVLRLGPGGAIMLLVYEHVYEYLQEKYPN